MGKYCNIALNTNLPPIICSHKKEQKIQHTEKYSVGSLYRPAIRLLILIQWNNNKTKGGVILKAYDFLRITK